MGNRFLRSLRFAGRGLATVYQTEQNFRLQLIALVGVVTLGGVLHVGAARSLVLIIVGTAVLVLECINSAVERLLDLVQPRLHGYVREIKDLMAGAVLIASLGAAVVGFIILVPSLLSSLHLP